MSRTSALRHLFVRVVMISAVAVVVGSFLPWVSVLDGAISKNGIEGDGVLTLFLALACAVLVAFSDGRRWMLIVSLVCAALVAVIGVVDLADIDGSDVGDVIDANPGVGLWIVLIAGLAMTVAAALVLAKRRVIWGLAAEPRSASPPAT